MSTGTSSAQGLDSAGSMRIDPSEQNKHNYCTYVLRACISVCMHDTYSHSCRRGMSVNKHVCGFAPHPPARKHAHKYMHTHTHTSARTHTHTRAHTHTHTHGRARLSLSLLSSLSLSVSLVICMYTYILCICLKVSRSVYLYMIEPDKNAYCIYTPSYICISECWSLCVYACGHA